MTEEKTGSVGMQFVKIKSFSCDKNILSIIAINLQHDRRARLPAKVSSKITFGQLYFDERKCYTSLAEGQPNGY